MKKTRKILIGVGAAVFLLAALVIALPFVVDVNRFKGPILQKVEENINGKVTLDKIGLKLFPFIGLRLEGLAVRNLPESPFADTPLLKLGEMDFRIHLKSILQRRLVASLLLRAPELQFIKTAAGSNVDLLIKKPSEAPPPPPVEEKKAEPAMPGLVQDVVVERVSIKDGLLVSDDRTAGKPPMKISGLRLEITNAVLTDTSKPIGIDLGLRLFDAAEENVAFQAKVSADQKAKVAKLENAKLVLAGSEIVMNATIEDYEKQRKVDAVLSAPAFAMNSVYALVPDAKKSLPPDTRLDGSLALNVTAQGTPESMNVDLTVDLNPAGIQYGETFVKPAGTPMNFAVKAHYTPANPDVSGSLSIESFRSTIYTLTNLKSAFAYGGKIARLSELGFDLFEGHFSGSGQFDMNPPKPGWDFSFQIEHLNMDGALTATANAKDVLTGSGNLDLAIKGTGMTAEEVKKTLSGQAQFTLRDGELKAINLGPALFSEKLLGVLGSVIAGAPASLQSSKFQELAGRFTIENGKVIFPETSMASSGDLVQMSGTVGLDQTLDLSGKYLLSKENTEGWITNAKLRPYLTDKGGRFIVPFKITGELKSPMILPDVAYVGELAGKALAGVAKEEVKARATQEIQQAAPQVQQKAEEEVKKIAPDIGSKLKKLF